MNPVSLDCEDEDKFRVHGVNAVPDAPLVQPIQRSSQGISSASSIGRMGNEAPPPRHRPQLEPPASFRMSTEDLGERDKIRSSRLVKAIAPEVSEDASSSRWDGSMAKTEGRYDEGAAGQSPVEILKGAATPKVHYMLDLLYLHQKVEDTVAKELIVFKAQSKTDVAEIERLQKAKDEALQKYAADAASRNNWTVLGNIAQYLVAGTSIAVGITLGGWGTMLVASGVAGLGYRVIRDTVGWESVAAWLSKSVETQKKLVHQIEMGFLTVELGTGLAGGVGACWAGSFSVIAKASRLDNARKLVGGLQGVGSMVKTTSQLGRAFVDKRVNDVQAEIRVLDAHAERIRTEMRQEIAHARNMIDTAQAVGRNMQEAISASEIHSL